MCRCNPLIRTPWCGKPGCEVPIQVKEQRKKQAEESEYESMVREYIISDIQEMSID